MANLVPSGVDLTTGQRRPLDSSDALTDTSGNLLIRNSVRILANPTITTSNAGNTTLYIVPTGKTVFVSEILVAVESSTDIDTSATISVGATTSDDIVSSIQLLGLTQTGRYYSLDVSDQSAIATAGDSIIFYITSAATGAGSPAQTATVYLLGIET